MPQLADPNFSRAVVLMIENSDLGSFGLVINHPSPIKATELLESLEMAWRGEDSAVVWAGGPVSPSTGWVLHEPIDIAQPGAGTIVITSGISLSTSPPRPAPPAGAPASPPTRWRAAPGSTPPPTPASSSTPHPTTSGTPRCAPS